MVDETRATFLGLPLKVDPAIPPGDLLVRGADATVDTTVRMVARIEPDGSLTVVAVRVSA